MTPYTALVGAALVAVTLASPLQAEPMSAAEVQAFFGAGGFSARAGSKFGFSADGTFSIEHSSGSEKGTYTIGSDGVVTRMRTGSKKPDVFYIDVNAKGKKTIVYTAGQYKGKKFALK